MMRFQCCPAAHCRPAFALWGKDEAKIAQVELLQALMALLTFPVLFRNKASVFHIDTLASMCTLRKGRSSFPELDAKMSMGVGVAVANDSRNHVPASFTERKE